MGILDGGVAILTGAASGIGRATAIAFAREGAEGVVVSDVNSTGGEETVTLVRQVGAEAIFVYCDVSQETQVEQLVRETLDRFGRLDYAHNNAGSVPERARLADVTEASWDKLMSVHLKGVWLCMKHEIHAMLPRGRGSIVNTASTAGVNGAPLVGVYVAAKHGIVGLTKSAALDYARSGIRINAVCPGHTSTPMHAATHVASQDINVAHPTAKEPTFGLMERHAEPREQAEAVVWLCSERASFVTGTALAVDGGATAQLSN
jgi:NAD(P)-dependent dehydrogenase (short-subunit alcohol dehydrogenase family)